MAATSPSVGRGCPSRPLPTRFDILDIHKWGETPHSFDLTDALKKRGVTREKLDEIWDMTESFRGYSFCKPHSASFAMVSYKSAYLKAHYPAEFMAAVISNQGGFYTTFAYISEAKRMGIRVLRPDVNRSEFLYQAEDDQTPGCDQMASCESPCIRPWMAIRMGFMQIKGLNKKSIQAILEERKRRGPFTSLQDLLARASVPEGDGTLLITYPRRLEPYC